MNRNVLMLGAAMVALTSYSSVALAEDAGAGQPQPATTAAPAQPSSVTEVIVTAQKRSERLVDVPMSVAAVSGVQLAQAGVQSMDDLRQITPGLLTVNNGFAFLPQIRGIQSSGTSPGDATNVAIYFDDVAAGAPIAGLMDLSDIDHVEVLKGPQGTLFGRNATGGAIRILTKAPSFTPGGSVDAEYGFDYSDLKLAGYATGPLTDNLAASLSASYRKGDGYIQGIGPDAGRTYGGPDNDAIRGKLLFKPSDEFKATLAVDTWTQHNNDTFTAGFVGNVDPTPGAPFSGVGTYAGGTQPVIFLRGSDASVDLDWTPSDALRVRSITGYREWRMDAQNDADHTSVAGNYVQIGQYERALTQEINVSGSVGKALTWLTGFYYFDNSAGNPYFRIGGGDAPGGPVLSDFTNHVQSSGYAGFGEVTWSPISQLHITGGIRYSDETKDFHYQDVIVFPGAPVHTTNTSHSWDSPTYRFVVRYDLMHDANVYVSVSDGFKSGVYNAYSYLANPVNPEKVTAYEVGAKARINGITYTAAAYAYQYDNIQVSAYVTVNNQLLVSLSNAAAAEMRGFEFTADGRIFEGLNFNVGVNWEPTSKYTNYKTAQVTAPLANPVGTTVEQVLVPYNASGSETVRTPEFTATARLHYEHPLWGGRFNGDISGAYTSKFYWQPGDFSPEAPSFVANARVGWTDTNRHTTYSFFVRNLTDQQYFTDRVAGVKGDTAELAPGREFGIGINQSF